MKGTRYVLAIALGMIALAAPSRVRADSSNISASERGWVCTPSGGFCSISNGASPGNNYIAGFDATAAAQFRDWFEFAIPILTGGPLVSATLNLGEPNFPVDGHTGGTLTYAVYGLSGQPTVFTDVTNSNPFGSVVTSSASNGTTVAITLDAAALTTISADQGGEIFIGGIDSGENTSAAGNDFAGTFANDSTVLSLQTAATTTPEPSTAVLLGIGLLGLMGMGLYKKRLV